jgi:uncharacterized protein (DUF169 family)
MVARGKSEFRRVASVETARELERIVHGRWHGITFINGVNQIPEGVGVKQAGRFCEAIKVAIAHKMMVRPSEFTCPGASYAFGGMVDVSEMMTERMVELKGYSPKSATHLIENTPHFRQMPDMIGFNCMDQPDILISQLQPEQAMKLLQLYHIKLGRSFRTEIPSVICACGNTVVRAYQSQDLSISFGCDDSRAFGGLSRDRLYVGLPYSLARTLVQ